ncbi:hypothetical protein AB688_00255 [Pseudomonas putida]|uniref:hypothetical protein n=1 Tax=Pseudomonas putida TaxID=303 RepID=UPI0007B6B1C0|nr:hypothetical protein [Pseudomonas putida]ANC00629.1 hypothetical protein AB688_00255 [Pseudomonas putida]
MINVYSGRNVTSNNERSIVNEYCDKYGTDHIDAAFLAAGYTRAFNLGTDEASIELYTFNKQKDDEPKEFTGIALVSLGEHIEEYAMPTFHDALDFMREYAPTIKGIIALKKHTDF